MKAVDGQAAWLAHGGRVDIARRAFPDAPLPWLDLSTGINPRPYPVEAGAGADLASLPSPARLHALERAAAACFGAGALPVAALPGSELGLRLAACLSLPAPVRHVSPSYGTYADMGATPIDYASACAAAGEGGTMILGNPNNPDGRLVPPAALLRLAHTLGSRNGLLIVDEAFADVAAGASILPALAAEDRVLVFRSFGKFFGLAGVRLGFVAGFAPMVERIRWLLGDWPISATALAIGARAYADDGWIAATRQSLTQDAAMLDTLLARHGLVARGGCPLFRLVDTPDAPAIFARLAARGILVRPFADRTDRLRFGLPGDAAAFDRLDRALGDGGGR